MPIKLTPEQHQRSTSRNARIFRRALRDYTAALAEALVEAYASTDNDPELWSRYSDLIRMCDLMRTALAHYVAFGDDPTENMIKESTRQSERDSAANGRALAFTLRVAADLELRFAGERGSVATSEGLPSNGRKAA